jgi:hypothetical protein
VALLANLELWQIGRRIFVKIFGRNLYQEISCNKISPKDEFKLEKMAIDF